MVLWVLCLVFFLGPHGCPVQISAADCAWAPFLERYAAQLPLLHRGLRPYDARLRELAGQCVESAAASLYRKCFSFHVVLGTRALQDPSRWPRLGAWYEAMDAEVPAYSARVRGDEDSWRKVLAQAARLSCWVPGIDQDILNCRLHCCTCQAGYGNAGVPTDLVEAHFVLLCLFVSHLRHR